MKRRSFVSDVLLGTMAAAIGTEIVFGAHMPADYVPIALRTTDPFKLFEKHSEMTVLNERPLNMEAQAHLLDNKITPNSKMFIRNNGLLPETIVPEKWELQVTGAAAIRPKHYTIKDLKSRFTKHTYQLTLECGGNGRSEFSPPAKGNQWTVGAVSCAQWSGVRLSDILDDVGFKENAVYIAYHAADIHLSRDPDKEPISRGIPLAKALQKETLLAYEMNGGPIPNVHGYPLRLVAGGWPASASGKWIQKLRIRDQVHDGAKMTGASYRVPCEPVAPGAKVADKDLCIIESMPVKSLITYPKTGAMFPMDKKFSIRGHAWAGELQVSKMEYSIDFGANWQECMLEKPVNRLAWQQFSAAVSFPKKGYYEVWARATDAKGNSQPMVVPGWNPKGYLNNACHRIAVKVTA
ncbi:sulfite oxidase [Maribacter sp. 2-571]|uniref:sulfite oxidase n=1 Tax=Maribacter sp. 2-571 TaxID=3417569 RepID=UPI003D344CEC